MRAKADELTPLAIGAVLGTAVAAIVAPLIRPLFPVPTGGVGWITVHHYPKTWDYAVVALLVGCAFAGATLLSFRAAKTARNPGGGNTHPRWIIPALIVFALTLAIDDTPNAPLDFFHEGERLTPAFLLHSGERPYRDVFFFHGLATDGGLTQFVLGDPPSLVRARRLEWLLGAATLALLAPIAAEVCATSAGVAIATFASWCALGAGVRVFFPYFRLAPLLVAVLAALRYVRTRKTAPLVLAAVAAMTGLVWSIDAGIFAIAALVILSVVLRSPRLLLVTAAAVIVPLTVLLAVRADLPLYFHDSFVTLPRGAFVNTIAAPALPSGAELPYWISGEAAKYYFPPIVYGLVVAIALVRWRSGDRVRAEQIAVFAVFSILLFRAAAGRSDANHVRFAMPLFGIIVVAFLIEPLALRRRAVATVIAALLFIGVLDAIGNTAGAADQLTLLAARHGHETVENPHIARDVAALGRYIASFGRGAQFLDVANNRALYFLLQRKPPVRCPDIMMWCDPAVARDEMARLERNPPACVILEGYAQAAMDDLPYDVRVPELGRWVAANYPHRLRFGRFVVAAK